MASKSKAVQPLAEQPAAKVAKTAAGKKKAASAWFTEDVRRVTEVLQAPVAERPNKDVRSMLLEGLPLAVTPVCDASEVGAEPEGGSKPTRHAFQEEILAFVRKALCADETAATEAKKVAADALAQAQELLDGVKNDANNADAAAQKAEEAISEADAQVKAAYTESTEAEVGHAEAKHATKPAQEAKLKAEALNVTVTDIAEHFKSLSELAEELQEATRNEQATRVTTFLEDTKAEKCLVVAAGNALPRSLADRGRFDKHTITSVGEFIEAKLKEAEERLAAAAPAVEMADAFELGMWAVLDLAREHEAACNKTLAAARATAKTAKQKEKEAGECVKVQEEELEQRRQEEVAAAAKLSAIEAALEGLDRLIAGVPAPAPVVEEPVAVAEPAVPESPMAKSPAASAKSVAEPSPGSVSKVDSPAKIAKGSPAATGKRAVPTPTRVSCA